MKLHNTYFLLRHGEAVSNVKDRNSSWPEQFRNPLTAKGKASVKKAAMVLKNNHAKHGKAIDVIFSSDILRAKQTAEIVGKVLKLPIKYDKELREIDFGNLNGQPFQRKKEMAMRGTRTLTHKLTGGESYEDVLKRIYPFFQLLEKKYKGMNILIVSHQAPLWLLENKVRGISIKQGIASKQPRINRGELRELN
jgi:broad specificity phosphatase PhoE